MSKQNQYEKIGVIGRGAFGKVYKGLDKKTSKTVAIKIIDLEQSEDDIEDVMKEIKSLKSIQCSNITQYYDSFMVQMDLWLILEYLGGGSVRDVIESRASGFIPELQTGIILRETLKALDYMHTRRMLHRDIKSANILLADNGDVKLADFGVVGKLAGTMDKRNTVVGTPYWMAPEVISQESHDQSADIWSLGITCIELSTGRPPLSEMPFLKALFYIPQRPAPTLEGSQYSEDLKEFCDMCLQKEPTKRLTARQLLEQCDLVKTTKGTANLTELIQDYKKARAAKQKAKEKDTVAEEVDEFDNVGDFNFTMKPRAGSMDRLIPEPEEEKKPATVEDEDDAYDFDDFGDDGFATQKITDNEILERVKKGNDVMSDSSDLRPTSAPQPAFSQPPPVEVETYQNSAILPRNLAKLLDTLKEHSSGVYKDYVDAIEVQCFKLNDDATGLRRRLTKLEKKLAKKSAKKKKR